MENQDPKPPELQPAPTPEVELQPGQTSEDQAGTNPVTTEAASSQSEPTAKQEPGKAKPGKLIRLKGWLASHKKISIPAGVIILLVILGIVPWSRYHIAGLALKQNVVVKVVDSNTGSPVSGATVSSGSMSGQTDGAGQVTLKLKDGYHQVSISKNYYTSAQAKILAPIFKQKSPASVSLVATGRQVKVSVTNSISGDPLAGADISVAGVDAKTDSTGAAIIVVPVGQASFNAKITLSGYNDLSTQLQASASEIKENDFKLTPAGKIYYLSNQGGNVNVMSVNLDGTGAAILLAGNGNENPDNSSMSVSPDNKYVALLTSRTSDPSPQLYVINTASGNATEVDHGSGNFSMDGWIGDDLIYHFSSNSAQTWQSGLNKLGSYNASTNKLTTLNSSSAVGNSSSAAQEDYNFVSVQPGSNLVLFGKEWQINYTLSAKPNLSSVSNTFNSISPDGSNLQVIAKYPSGGYIDYNQYQSDSYYISVNDGSSTSYYNYQIGGGQPKSVSISSDTFYKTYPAYYYSPDGQKTLWSEKQNGLEASFVGDSSGANGKQLGKDLTSQKAIGWYDNSYVLYDSTQTSCSIYIASTNGSKAVEAVSSCLSPTGSYSGD